MIVHHIGAATPSPALLDYLDRLWEAVKARDAQTVEAMFAERLAAQLPRDVMEESLAIARAPAGSLRAPVRLLRFYHISVRLLADAGRPSDSGRLQLELPFASPEADRTVSIVRPRDRRLAAAGEWELRPRRRRWK